LTPPSRERILLCIACFLCRLADNPLADFVELPPAYAELRYSNILCGVIRGALEMVRQQWHAGGPFVAATSATAAQRCWLRWDTRDLRWVIAAYAASSCAVLQVSVRVDCRFVKDSLNGDDTTELRVSLKEVLADAAGKDYKEEWRAGDDWMRGGHAATGSSNSVQRSASQSRPVQPWPAASPRCCERTNAVVQAEGAVLLSRLRYARYATARHLAPWVYRRSQVAAALADATVVALASLGE